MNKKIGFVLLLIAFTCFGCASGEKTGVLPESNLLEDRESTQAGAGLADNGNYSPIIATEVQIPEAEYPYMIRVNRAMNCVTIYTLDGNQEYSVPVRAMICSCGGDKTPLGSFQTGDTYDWLLLSGGVYGQYATRVVDDILFHSVPYLTMNKDSLMTEEFNKLGESSSAGCIRLESADAEWILKNCLKGTKIEIVDDTTSPGPLGKPDARLISGDVKWDPTDNDAENGWYVPISFKGITDREIHTGENINLLDGISAKDKHGNDLTSQIQVFGNVDVNNPGTYKVTYSCTNQDNAARQVDANIVVAGEAVTEAPPEPTPQPATSKPAATERIISNAVTPSLWMTSDLLYLNGEVSDIRQYLLSYLHYNNFGEGFDKNSVIVHTEDLIANCSNRVRFEAIDTDGRSYSAYATVVYDCIAPQISLTATSRYVLDVKKETLAERVNITDTYGIFVTYITRQYIISDDSYVIIYEAVDNAGNKSCVSEKVFIAK